MMVVANIWIVAAAGCAPPEPAAAPHSTAIAAAEGPAPTAYFSVCNEADPADGDALAGFAAREGNLVVSAASAELTGETRHVRIVSGGESLEYDCRELRLAGPAMVVGQEAGPLNWACIPDVATFRETAEDGSVRVPFPGTGGSVQMDVLRSRRGLPLAIVGRSEGGVFVSSMVVAMERGDLVLRAARVSASTLRANVGSLRGMM